MAEMLHSRWLFTGGIVHFLTRLNAGGKNCLILCLFFNEHELCAKTARILRLFFNEHELCAKTARIPSHMIGMSHVKRQHLDFAPHPFFMQVRKRLILRV